MLLLLQFMGQLGVLRGMDLDEPLPRLEVPAHGHRTLGRHTHDEELRLPRVRELDCGVPVEAPPVAVLRTRIAAARDWERRLRVELICVFRATRPAVPS
jgi:hypothetical protein